MIDCFLFADISSVKSIKIQLEINLEFLSLKRLMFAFHFEGYLSITFE